jgi:hypothetical protein
MHEPSRSRGRMSSSTAGADRNRSRWSPPREALQRPGKTRGRILPAGKQHERRLSLNPISAIPTNPPFARLDLTMRRSVSSPPPTIQIKDRKILAQSLGFAGARDHDDAR